MKRTQLAEAERLIEVMREALRDCVDFLDHSGSQRSVLSGKFVTPSARYDWF